MAPKKTSAIPSSRKQPRINRVLASLEAQDEEIAAALDAARSQDEDDNDDPGPRRSVGRPRIPNAVVAALFSDDYEMIEWSLTIAKRGAHMPLIWHTAVADYLDVNAEAFEFSTERGGRADHLHGQGIVRARCKADKESIDRWKKELKQAMGVRHGDGSGCTIELKPLVDGQTFQRMVGYVNKDRLLTHFRRRSKGVSEELRAAGIEELTQLRLSFLDDKIVLNKANLLIKAHNFHGNEYPDDKDISLTQVLADMHNNKKYIIAPTVLMSANGQMRRDAAETYWSLLINPAIPATSSDMSKILYIPQPFNRFFNSGYGGGPPADDTPVRPHSPQPMGDFEPLPEGSSAYDQIKHGLAHFRAEKRAREAEPVEVTEHDTDDDASDADM